MTAAIRTRSKLWLYVSLLLGLVYVGYILWSKFAKVMGAPPIKLGEVGEFLLFLAAIVAFTLQVFTEDAASSKAERSEDQPKDHA